MMRTATASGVVALLCAVAGVAAATSCSVANKCPQDTPCCSQYGECGVGAYCLGGCDPRMSFSLDACMPEPVCKDKTYPMDSLDGIVDISDYLGDASKADWVSSGTPLLYNGTDKYLLLTMKPNSPGTVLATTEYIWYGNVKGTFKTSRGAGVVTAFILLSDVHDEIDLEFVGTELTTAQTNYYYQGILDYTHSENVTVTDTYDNFHDYEIDWTPNNITWFIDGQSMRTVNRADTWNESAQAWNYPQTPSRLEISIWPGGASSNSPGTIEWAGGAINWDSPDIQQYGYDFATFGQISVKCYAANSPPGTNSGASYYYTDALGFNSSVVNGGNGTVLASFSGTGLNPEAGKSSTTMSGSSPSSSANTVPGGTGVGSVPGGSTSGGSRGGSSGSSSGCSSGFSQSGCSSSSSSGSSGGSSSSSSSSSSKSEAGHRMDRTLGSSALAMVIGLAGLMLL